MSKAQQEVLQASRKDPILVQFFATWCRPCQVIKPVLADLESKANGAWRLASVNVEEHPEFAAACIGHFKVFYLTKKKLYYH